MKRNMEIVIEIAKAIEERTSEQRFLEFIILDDKYDHDIVQYQLKLMWKANLIEAMDISSMDGEEYLPGDLTWAGHEFLDAARNDNVVERAKGMAKEKGFEFASLPFDLAKDLLVHAAKGWFGLE
ncbi:DUF2513 domain-containing protein [Cohnella soli]|uniref:DUF2513 domain-containing protein n=1 Tax=Cohnella soli TaxID=425005 RepID=A0ABW0HKK2_9BACL